LQKRKNARPRGGRVLTKLSSKIRTMMKTSEREGVGQSPGNELRPNANNAGVKGRAVRAVKVRGGWAQWVEKFGVAREALVMSCIG